MQLDVQRFEWTMQGALFKADVLIMPIKGCELIMRMEWLNSLEVWQMEFAWNGRLVVLQAKEAGSFKIKEGKVSQWKDKMWVFIMKEDQGQKEETTNKKEAIIPEGIITLLEKFQH